MPRERCDRLDDQRLRAALRRKYSKLTSELIGPREIVLQGQNLFARKFLGDRPGRLGDHLNHGRRFEHEHHTDTFVDRRTGGDDTVVLEQYGAVRPQAAATPRPMAVVRMRSIVPV